jgi:hypothetical protein
MQVEVESFAGMFLHLTRPVDLMEPKLFGQPPAVVGFQLVSHLLREYVIAIGLFRQL